MRSATISGNDLLAARSMTAPSTSSATEYRHAAPGSFTSGMLAMRPMFSRSDNPG
jgi:hypothetical protein